ncbi:MAG: hypothetical protein PUJ57_03815 [Peptoniphilaceae bacterium]|nr:hypothetical protein [Peptoniphilaceae bacterium]MDY6085181.1 hypothetical protein [Peptoniphilaceae bacterium]
MKPTDSKKNGAKTSNHHSRSSHSTTARVVAIGLAVAMVLGIIVMAIQSAKL